jgi:ABC-type multidrug transport system fused ATPase/permease subunit
MAITMPKFSEAQKMLDGVSLTARENLTGARVVRAFGVEDVEIAGYKKRVETLEKFQNATGKISAALNPLTFCVVNLAIVALLYFGGIKVSLGILTQGAIIALYDYLSQILVELIKFANLVVSISKAIASGKRISQTLEIQVEEESVLKDEENSPFIEFKNVCATYGGGDVLTNLNFTIEKGQTVGVIGGTGSGKTTIINLLMRFYDVNEGAIYVDGKNIKEYDDSKLKTMFGTVFQQDTLFSNTIHYNVDFNRNLSPEQIEKALKVAQAYDFVYNDKEGLETELTARGNNLSGGQKQRLLIARALANEPKILVLDDSSSALDYKTDSLLRSAIIKEYNPTLFIISQRISSIMNMDQIIVMDDGVAVAIGKHEELLETCKIYQDIYKLEVGNHGGATKKS